MPTGRSSTISTDAPRLANSCATAHPTIPAPTTMMSEGRPIKRQLNASASSPLQECKGVIGPRVLAETWNAPELTERLDGPGRLRGAHVGAVPSELLQDARRDLLRFCVVPAVEHR